MAAKTVFVYSYTLVQSRVQVLSIFSHRLRCTECHSTTTSAGTGPCFRLLSLTEILFSCTRASCSALRSVPQGLRLLHFRPLAASAAAVSGTLAWRSCATYASKWRYAVSSGVGSESKRTHTLTLLLTHCNYCNF